MIVNVNIEMEGIAINEAFTGVTAEEAVGKMKARVAREMNFAMRLAINAMSDLMFAQEVVKRYGEFKKRNLPLPVSCQEFLTLAQQEGLATIQE